MGNSLGVDCSSKKVYMTHVVVNSKSEKEEKPCVKNLNHASSPIAYSNYQKEDKNEEVNQENLSKKCMLEKSSYEKMQQDLTEYFVSIRSIILETVQVYVIQDKPYQSYERQLCFNQMNKEGIKEKEEDGLPSTLKKDYHCLGMKQDKSKNEQNMSKEIMQIYFWSLDPKNITFALKKGMHYLKNTPLHITGSDTEIIKKKLLKMKFSSISVCYHDEMYCSNIPVSFFKQYYPNCIFRLQSIFDSKDKNNKHISKCNNATETKQISMNEKELDELTPYLMVNVQSSTRFHMKDEKGILRNLGTIPYGETTLSAMWHLLTGTVSSLKQITYLGERGTYNRFDMLVGDIFGSSYDLVGLDAKCIASAFGKAQNQNYLKKVFRKKGDSLKSYIDMITKEKILYDEEESSSNEDEPSNTSHFDSKQCNICQSSVLSKTTLSLEKIKCSSNQLEGSVLNGSPKDSCTISKEPPIYEKREVLENIHMERMKNSVEKYEPDAKNETAFEPEKENKLFMHEESFEWNSMKCDLATSLLSIVTQSIAQQSYCYSLFYKLTNIIFIGSSLLYNKNFMYLIQNYIHYLSKEKINIYYLKIPTHCSSLGASLHPIEWNKLQDKKD